MFKVVSKQVFSSGINVIDIEAKELVESFRPGQFVFLTPDPQSRRIVVSSLEVDQRRGTVSVIFNQATQDEFKALAEKKIGDAVEAISGPYGVPFPPAQKENILAIVQGVRLVSLLPLGRYYKTLNAKVTAVVGLKSRRELFYESKLRVSCEKIFFTTEDGSYEKKGSPTILLDELLKKKPSFMYIEGDLAFCRKICEVAVKSDVKIFVNLIAAVHAIYHPLETASINFHGQIIYPAVDGFIVNGRGINFTELETEIQRYEEFEGWLKSKSQSRALTKESGTLRKWFSGLIKETP